MSSITIETSDIIDTLIIQNIIQTIGGITMKKNLRLKAARAAKDLSQAKLAEVVGVTRQTMNAIENGDYNPSLNLCIGICKALDLTLNDLFWEE
jgi:putative transcriptional regulator